MKSVLVKKEKSEIGLHGIGDNGTEARQAYEAWHLELTVDAENDTPWHKLLRTHLNNERDLLGKKVLEIGCGRGDFTCWLARQQLRPREIVAADFALTAVQKGRAFAASYGLSGVTWQVQDIQALGYPDASFDTVISCETIEHVPDPRQALCELARVLKPGGRLFLTTPNYLGVYGLYRMYLRLCGRRYTEAGQPINNLVLLPLTKIWVTSAGLHVTAVDAIGHYLLWPGHLPKELSLLNNPRWAMRWLGLHSIVVAEKAIS
jgi:2-polyprenyl-3-methyl-5-hydroxy-6-metoxy-1,4-benzoquinol methylase